MPVELSRDPGGKPITNVAHRVTRGNYADIDKNDFEWGYVGAGPNELAMNILYTRGVSEQESLRLSTLFAHDILSGIPQEGATIHEQVIDDWIRTQKSMPEQSA